jgi:ankyrin repeat protein
MNGYLEIMKYLEKEHNWDIYITDNYGNNAYLLASFYDKIEIMKYLETEHNYDIHIQNKFTEDAYYCSKYNYTHIKVIKHLENKIFYENLSKCINKFLELKDKEINKLTEKIKLVNNFLEKS